MTSILNSLMCGGYDPYDIDVSDVEVEHKDHYVPDIESQYVVYYQENGKSYYMTFTVYEYEDSEREFHKALNFAKTHDTLIFFEEPTYQFFNPKTGENVKTPDCGRYCKDYYNPPLQPYQHGFTAVETDELPF